MRKIIIKEFKVSHDIMRVLFNQVLVIALKHEFEKTLGILESFGLKYEVKG